MKVPKNCWLLYKLDLFNHQSSSLPHMVILFWLGGSTVRGFARVAAVFEGEFPFPLVPSFHFSFLALRSLTPFTVSLAPTSIILHYIFFLMFRFSAHCTVIFPVNKNILYYAMSTTLCCCWNNIGSLPSLLVLSSMLIIGQ